MTPLAIQVLIECYCMGGLESAPVLERQLSNYTTKEMQTFPGTSVIEDLLRNKLIRECEPGEQGDMPFTATDRGRAYLSALQRVPLPEPAWMWPKPLDLNNSEEIG